MPGEHEPRQLTEDLAAVNYAHSFEHTVNSIETTLRFLALASRQLGERSLHQAAKFRHGKPGLPVHSENDLESPAETLS